MGQNCKPYMVLWYLLSIHSSSNPNADILVTSLVLKHCAHALRQPRGCYFNYTVLTCPRLWKGNPTNVCRPPAAPGTASPHLCRCPDSRHVPTPHLRTPYAGTARAHTSSRAPSRSLETGFSAYGSRARATPAIRPRTVHMTWDREA